MTPRPPILLLALAAWLAAGSAVAQDVVPHAALGRLTPETAAPLFDIAKRLSHRDAGRLWGRKLYGHMLFVEPATRTVITNWRDREGMLKKDGRVWVGTLPPGVQPANTLVDLGGVTWSMIVWPPPPGDVAAGALMMHECFHRIQMDLDLPPWSPPNHHLDSMEARYWLRLELRALEAAVRDASSPQAARDALLFRHRRRAGDETAADEERRLELNEGLAEYTGVRLCDATDEERTHMIATLLRHNDSRSTSLMRSFAYATGAAYATLLDHHRPDWRDVLTPDDDLGGLLADVLPWSDGQTPLREAADARAASYAGDVVRAEETERHEARAERLERLRTRFTEGPQLVIELRGARTSFDQAGLSVLPGLGTVYRTMFVSDDWGRLAINGSGLVVRGPGKPRTVRVPAPADPVPTDGIVTGDGWRLELAEGWILDPAGRSNELRVRRKR